MAPVVLSHYQCRPLLALRDRGEGAARTSLDLGLTDVTLTLSKSGLVLPGGEAIPWATIEEIAESLNACFTWRAGSAAKIQAFSDNLNRVYTLYPTERAPTMLISGIPMHRIKNTDPYQDTLAKIRAISPISGLVLDTATGLGYTAIEAAKTADLVTTIELDPTVLDICRNNPWSQALFDDSRIEQLIGDAYDLVETMPASAYSCIIHDPPTFSLAGHLYSADFYRQLRRILLPRGRLYHYIGDPASKSGRSVTRGVVKRLKDAGFRRLSSRPQAFGVVAYN